jgi:hypothetical protein
MLRTELDELPQSLKNQREELQHPAGNVLRRARTGGLKHTPHWTSIDRMHALAWQHGAQRCSAQPA